MMNQREKLSKLITEHIGKTNLVDYLLANGVVVLPCKVGDTVYEVFTWHDCTSPYPCYCCDEEAELAETTCGFHKIRTCIFERRFDYTMIDEISKTIFLTREEAERALETKRR